MHSTSKKWLLFIQIIVIITIKSANASSHCEQKWDDIKGPHIIAENYHIHLLKINSTDEFKTFMPNTKYQSKYNLENSS